MKTKKQETNAVDFFYEHAGWGYNPQTETPEEGKRRGAELLAKAEKWAKDAGVDFEWRKDGDADRSWMEPDDGRPLWACLAQLTCPTCGKEHYKRESLWGIDLGPKGETDKNYKRVVQAELALEMMEE